MCSHTYQCVYMHMCICVHTCVCTCSCIPEQSMLSWNQSGHLCSSTVLSCALSLSKTCPCLISVEHHVMVLCSLMCTTGTVMGHMTTLEVSLRLWRKCCVLHNKRYSHFDYARWCDVLINLHLFSHFLFKGPDPILDSVWWSDHQTESKSGSGT